MERRRLKDRGVLSYNCSKLNQTNKHSAKILREFTEIAEHPPHQLIRLGSLEIHISLSNLNIDVKILAQGYCVAIVSLSLLLT